MNIRIWLMAACWLLVFQPAEVRAGMPSPLPTDFTVTDIARDFAGVLRLEADALRRLRAVSFFVLAFLVSAWIFQKLWNYLQRDFNKLPRLSYRKSLGFVFLWGLLFIVVLTMISGARELMTPGAWKKQSYTYKLAGAGEPGTSTTDRARRQGLERLRLALWRFAATHEGRFPARTDTTSIAVALWEVPGTATRYVYVEGLSAGHLPLLVAYEPELDPEQRYVLRADGEIVTMTTAELQQALERERP